MSGKNRKIAEQEREWREGTVNKALKRFPILKEAPSRFYTPNDLPEDFDFLDKVGFPGQYPFTAGVYPFDPATGMAQLATVAPDGAMGRRRAAGYSGYGAPEDTRDYYQAMIDRGGRAGPNLAMDLPTQCGYDSDNPLVEGEVGKVGVAIDSLRDFEVIYEPYQGDLNLDRISSNFTIPGTGAPVANGKSATLTFALVSAATMELLPQFGVPKSTTCPAPVRGTWKISMCLAPFFCVAVSFSLLSLRRRSAFK